MSDLTSGFDANNVEPSVAYVPVPNGQYKAVIVDAQEKPTKDNAGKYLALTFQLTEGEHAGRKITTRLNLHNTNAETVKYARADLSAICRAVGVMQLKDK